MNKGSWLFKGWIIAAVCLIGSIAGYGQKRSYAPTSVLATGKWYKISVAHSGVHRLTYDDLVSIGLDTPSKVRIFGNGGSQLPYDSGKPRTDDLVECPVTFFKGSDGVFNSGDWIVFYAQGPVIWKYDATRQMFLHRLHLYSDLTYYFLTDDLGQAISVPEETTPDQPATTVVTEYDDYDFREKDSLNLIKSGRQWAWKHFAIQLRWGFNFSFPNRLAGAPVKVLSSLWARSSRNSQNSKFFLEEGDNPFQTIDLPGVNTNNYEALYASTAVTQSEFSPADNNFRLNIQFNPSNPAAEGWLDYLDLNTRSALRYRDTPLFFRDLKSTGAGSIASFSIQEAHAGMMVWDVTNPQKIKRMATSLSNRILSFKATADSLHEYILFDPSDPDLPVPVYQGEGVGEIANQNLHGMEAPDMIIIVHEGLKSYAQQLADYHHEKDGLVSQLVTPDEIYNEFSSGIPDVSAIRDFLKMFFDRAGNQPMKLKYLLLFGDGSYDNKGIGKTFKTCLPTYQSLESLYPTSSYLSDDFYGLLGDHDEMESGKLDLGIGRLPVLTENDAAIVVDKILHYKDRSTFGDWRNLVCFIGDDEDGNGHMRDANILADKLRDEYPAFNVDKIFLDAYQQVSVPAGERYPEVNRAINDRVRKGALIINYLGHGSERGLAHEEILTTSDIKNWTNKNRLPLFMTATCEFSRFDDIELVSAGEWVLLNPNGGGIALFSTTRLVYSSPNFRLNKLFYDYIFKTNATGKPNRLGDVMRLTKNAVGSELNKLSFSLLGDPALTLDFPENEIRMTEINDQPVNTFKDTLKALSKVKISGYVSNHQGDKLDQFNGTVTPTVFDKEVTLTNLANDGGPIMEFTVRNSILFRGKASVSGGRFNFSFVIPKDIAYQVGTGKFSFYATNEVTDAHGVNLTILFGGSGSENIKDHEGPDIRLFMNDTTFVDGGITGEKPVFLARLQDEYGINTVGNGIGHDITATLDDNHQDLLVLNDYYESDLDNYHAGTIRYPLDKLEPGEHTIHLKVWDILNNSSEADLSFTVYDSRELKIDHLLNYPNPFTTHTDFYFEHNQGDQTLEVLIQIFTVSGRLVKSFEFIGANQTEIKPGSFRIGPVSWDGLDDFGDRIGRGTYIYRVKVHTNDGKSGEAYQKLVILR